MNQENIIEVEIFNLKDLSIIDKSIASLNEVKFRISPPSRTIDAVTIISLIGGSLAIVNSILELYNSLKKKDDKIVIVVHHPEKEPLTLQENSKNELIELIGEEKNTMPNNVQNDNTP